MQHVTALTNPSTCVVDDVARHLSHPGFGRMACGAGKSDTPAFQIEEEKDVIGGESATGENLHSEKSLPATTAMWAETKSFQVVV